MVSLSILWLLLSLCSQNFYCYFLSGLRAAIRSYSRTCRLPYKSFCTIRKLPLMTGITVCIFFNIRILKASILQLYVIRDLQRCCIDFLLNRRTICIHDLSNHLIPIPLIRRCIYYITIKRNINPNGIFRTIFSCHIVAVSSYFCVGNLCINAVLIQPASPGVLNILTIT